MDKAALALNGTHNGGAPLRFSRTIAKQICKAVATSAKSLERLCLEHKNDWPPYDSIVDARRNLPWFNVLMTEARAKQADLMAAKTQDIADDLRLREDVTMPQVQATKLYCENTRWYASRIHRAVYGDEPAGVNVGIGVQVTVPADRLASIRSRLDHARALVAKGKAMPSAGEPEQALDRGNAKE